MRRSWRRRSLAFLAGGLASFAVGECLVRAFVGAPLRERLHVLEIRANATRGWEMVPGLHYTYEHPVHVNALGLRGPEVEPKVPGEVRVLALGDSLTYGQGVADDETLPAHLERELRERDPTRRFTVVNAGLRAYDTRQELALFEELGEAIDPDVVILFWYWNDFYGRDLEATRARLEASGPVAFDTGTRIEGWERVKWSARQVLRASALVMFLHDAGSGFWAETHTEAETARGFSDLDPELERFAALARSRGARALVAAIPDPSTLEEPRLESSTTARVLGRARAHGLPTLDLEASLRPVGEERLSLFVLPFDGHYTSEGNRRMAVGVALAVRACLAEAAH